MSYTLVDIGIGSAYDFFFEIASPNHREFALNQSSRLAALNAAWPLWHMHEWYFWEHHPSATEDDRAAYIKQELLRDCPELGWLRDIAEAGKHRQRLRRKTIKVRAISSREEEFSAALGDAPFGTVPFGSGSGKEFVVDVAGKTHPLMRAMGAAWRYWLGKVLPHHVEIPFSPDEMPERSEKMLSWCRDHLGDETARKPRWTLLQGANQPNYIQRLAFLTAEDAHAFRCHFAAG
jgi:hypothetical protein